MAYDFEKWVANDRKLLKRQRYLPHWLGLMMVVMIVSGVLETFDNGIDTDWLPSMVPFTGAILLTSLASPFARDTLMGSRTKRVFDEFERDALSRATVRAYSTMMLLLLPLFAWLWLASVNGWPAPRTALDWSSLGLGVLGVGFVLPIFFAEIAMPFPPTGDAADD